MSGVASTRDSNALRNAVGCRLGSRRTWPAARGRLKWTSQSFAPVLFRQSETCARISLPPLTVAAISLPQGIAYALLVGVDPRYGLYSAVVVTFVASVFGSSRHLINVPTSAISLVVFGALWIFDSTQRADAEAMFLLGIMVGAIQILIAVFRLGDLTESVILGFMAAAALLLGVGQISSLLGVRDRGTGAQHILLRLWCQPARPSRHNLRKQRRQLPAPCRARPQIKRSRTATNLRDNQRPRSRVAPRQSNANLALARDNHSEHHAHAAVIFSHPDRRKFRITSPEVLSTVGVLPHLICSRAYFVRGGDEAGQHDDA